MINLYINQRHVGDVTILDLKGRVRIGGDTISLHRSIRNLVEEGKLQILLDLANVTSIDSSGLGQLISSQVTLGNKGGEIKLFHLTESLREIMAITRLVSVFDIYDTELEAIAGFGSFVLKVKTPQPFFV